ncbi:MAG: ribosome-associated translation inhibitor RaiA [Nitrospirae bacterium]|nr:ribosome-associated translation inhibitor RaiA [Nitrospirota bacterium]
MNIIINGRHLELTDTLKNYAEDKIQKFSKYLTNISEATITLSVEKYRHKAEVLLKVNGAMIQAESITGDMYSSVDEVVEKLGRQVKKHKEKLVSHRKGEENVSEVPGSEESFQPVIKMKAYDIKPMTPEEAAMQLELLEKTFFVFTDSSSGNINVLYKRKDGHFGLIAPAK